MSAGFTKGPWSIAKQYVMGPGDNGKIARGVEYVGEFRAEGEANLHLIAAAPELFEALKQARGQVVGFMLECGHSAESAIANVTRLDAALAKARAETPNDGSIPSGGSGL